MKCRQLAVAATTAGVLLGAALGAAAPAFAAPVKLRWTMWAGQPEELAAWKGWARGFEQLHPGVKVEMEFPGDYIGQMLVTTAAGKAPDVVRTHSEYIYDWMSRGIIRPLDDFLKKDRSFNPSDWFPTVRQLASYQGRVYGIPSDYSTYMTFYNTQAFAEAGLVSPSLDPDAKSWTWEGFLEAARKLTVVDAAGAVKRWGFANEEQERMFSSLLWQNGGRFLSAKRDEIAFTSQEGVEAMQFAGDLVSRYKVMPRPTTTAGYRDLFTSRKVGMIWDGNWMKSTFAVKKGLQFAGAVMPMKKTRASWVGASMWCMSPLSKHKEIAWEFIKYIANEERQLESDRYGADDGLLLPPMRSAYANAKWRPGAVTQAATKQLDYGQIEQIPNLAGFYQLVWPQVRKVMAGGTSAKAALESIVPQAKRFVVKK